jgi:maltose alpha-D-glucosyltransferase/alpha-amylase
MLLKTRDRKAAVSRLEKPLWYKDAVIYELHVRSFQDSDGDGAGDFRGLTDKLDYLQDLGVTALWLLPFYPSPWRDDGYDIADYMAVHPAYGTLRDFQVFLKEAHRRGLRVITELVLNHTSDQHPWFQRSRQAKPGSTWRNFYVWSETPGKYSDARIIFKDFESSNWAWDPVAKAYYWHRFYSHQPDLNYDCPDVRRAVMKAVDFWFDIGVDGLRLDAVPYLFEREGTSCENLPETHAFLRELRHHIDQKYEDRMLVAGANQWPEDSVAYFGDGDECHMAFHFPVMPRLFMAIRREDRFPIIDILDLTPGIPASCQWAMFLRNHDELTLEMVTDEERDYMYRIYAQDPNMRINLGIRRRLAPLLGNQRKRIELMNALLLALPGTPVIYYGDEIGMGDNAYLGDRNGVRTPMQWSADRNAGFSNANPQRLYLPIIIDPEYHYEAVNVEIQQNNPHSLLWWMKRLIGLRRQSKALAHGSIEFLHPENRRVLAFLRRHEGEKVLVVANLSRFPQPATLDLSGLKGMIPYEAFGRVEFPQIGEQPYIITLGSHSFYWFHLESNTPLEIAAPAGLEKQVPSCTDVSWESPWENGLRANLSRILPTYLPQCRWFQSKARVIRSAEIVEVIPFPPTASYFLVVQVKFNEGDAEFYLLPVTVAMEQQADQVVREMSSAVVAALRGKDQRVGVLDRADLDKKFCNWLLQAIAHRRRFKGEAGELIATPTKSFRSLAGPDNVLLEARVQKAEQSNSSIIYQDHFILKLFRRLEEGTNPDLEIGRFLTEKKGYPFTPQLAGCVEYVRKGAEPLTIAVLQGFIANEGDAWRYTIDALGRYFARAQTKKEDPQTARLAVTHPLHLMEEEFPPLAVELIRNFLEDSRLLGQRTAELHLALSRDTSKGAFRPEPFTDFYQKGLYHGMISLSNRSLQLLRQRTKNLAADIQSDANQVLESEGEIRKRFRSIRDLKITAMRIRHHGDFHLGQVLFTGKDFVVIDFEGEPARPLSERRIKGSPLRDVAGMLRSFHYAASAVLYGQVPGVTVHPASLPTLSSWADFWYSWVSASFLRGYLTKAGQALFVPQKREDLRALLDSYLIEKAVYEVSYELNNRPEWVRIPLRGILSLLEKAA